MKTAIILHLHYDELWPEFEAKLKNILDENISLYITLNNNSNYINDMLKYTKNIFVLENRGMDVAPFIWVYNKIKQLNLKYEYYIKLHGKKSIHTPGIGEHWRNELVDSLIGDKNRLNDIFDAMNFDKSIYITGSSKYFCDKNIEQYHSVNRLSALGAINRVNNILNVCDYGCFIAGTMFIISSIYLDLLFNGVNLNEFYDEFETVYNKDSTLAHGMERVFGYGVEHYKGTYLLV